MPIIMLLGEERETTVHTGIVTTYPSGALPSCDVSLLPLLRITLPYPLYIDTCQALEPFLAITNIPSLEGVLRWRAKINGTAFRHARLGTP